MAAQSVKLIGNVVQEFGDMLLFTGACDGVDWIY
jgi:hypothetical protein